MTGLANRIEPFRALTFNRARAGDLGSLVAPPYDLVDAARQAELYARNPFNVIRLELNREADPYSAAAATLREWIAEGVLAQRARPAIYYYMQRFELAGSQRVRHGIVARIRLEEFASGRILPHERTFPKAKEDRLRLLTATRLNISPIFGLYPAGDADLSRLLAKTASAPPAIHVVDDLGITNEVREIDTPSAIATIQQALADVRVLIADGHHRYETALEYRRRIRAQDGDPAELRPYDYVMMTLVAFDDPGLVILPTHRLVRHLPPEAIAAFDSRAQPIFEIEQHRDPTAVVDAIAASRKGAIGVLLRSGVSRILRLKQPAAMAAAMPDAPAAVRDLDVSILHTLVLDRIFGIKADEVRKGGNLEYTIDAARAMAEVVAGTADGAFLMAPPTVDDVAQVCGAGATMPEKSTYFHPKLLTGLMMNPLD
jgi:uncharacterized protein (DUF1015 family)